MLDVMKNVTIVPGLPYNIGMDLSVRIINASVSTICNIIMFYCGNSVQYLLKKKICQCRPSIGPVIYERASYNSNYNI